jgi:hypothetical protein
MGPLDYTGGRQIMRPTSKTQSLTLFHSAAFSIPKHEAFTTPL